MKVLVLYDYPPSPGGLATQGDLLYRGLQQIGVDVHAVHFESAQEKEWYYRWFKPDIVIGIGYWGHTPHLVLHPQRYGVQPVPWLVADGYIANYHDVLNALPLILVTSNWVKETYVRDGIRDDIIEVLPVGCDTDAFVPRERSDPKVAAVREALGVDPEEIMVLTVGGDATSKGAQEVMQALAIIDRKAPPWKYVCKVWPQPRTMSQNLVDLQLATQLGIEKKVVYTTSVVSRNLMPYLIAACDIYAAPSRLEGFGMPQVEGGCLRETGDRDQGHGHAGYACARRDGLSRQRCPGGAYPRDDRRGGSGLRNRAPRGLRQFSDCGLPRQCSRYCQLPDGPDGETGATPHFGRSSAPVCPGEIRLSGSCKALYPAGKGPSRPGVRHVEPVISFFGRSQAGCHGSAAA